MLYNFGIFLYGSLVRVASLFNLKAKQWVDGRKNYWKNLPQLDDSSIIWFHCASVGEYEQGKPIMEKWKEIHPNDKLLVTFFSPSGYLNLKNKTVGDYELYLPLDSPKNAQKFIQYFQPKVTFFIKYEFWINYLNAAKKSGSKIYSISANFRENQRFFKWYGKKFRETLHLFDHIFVQLEESKNLLSTIGVNQVTVAGDTRYDRVIQRASLNRNNELIEPWAKGEFIFVIGSSWPEDERIILPFLNNLKIENKVIIAPHEVNKKHIEEITSQLSVSYQLYTNLQQGESLNASTKVLVIDCIGVLADAYKYGSLAYVGGAFGAGLHNILEPAAFGLPVIFGPHYDKFPEAKDFINSGIGISIQNEGEFFSAYQQFMENKQINEKVKEIVAKNAGATQIIMEKLR